MQSHVAPEASQPKSVSIKKTEEKISSQQFLFPQQVQLNPNELSLVLELEEEIKNMGFDFSLFGKDCIVLRGGPAEIQSDDPAQYFFEWLQSFQNPNWSPGLDKREKLARSLASKLSRSQKASPSAQQIKQLALQLFACQNPQYTPKGECIFHLLTLDHISTFFNPASHA